MRDKGIDKVINEKSNKRPMNSKTFEFETKYFKIWRQKNTIKSILKIF